MYGDFTDQMEGQTGYLVRSRDGGESWGEPELALRPRWWRGGTHTSLGMQTLSDGRILLPWTHGESLKHNPTGQTRFVCLRSDDHGRSWQGWDEHALPFHRVSPYGTIVELADGTLLCPVHGRLEGDRGYLGTCFVLRSSDRGVTWGDHSFICHEHPNGASETDVTLATYPGDACALSAWKRGVQKVRAGGVPVRSDGVRSSEGWSPSVKLSYWPVPGVVMEETGEGHYCVVTTQGGGPVMRQGGTIGRPSKTELRASITDKPFLRIVEI